MLQIIRRELLILFRDRGNLFFLLLFPSLLVFLLGNLLAQMDFADKEITPITIAYTIETSAPEETAIAEAFIEALAEEELLELLPVQGYEEGRTAVEQGRASGAVLFSPGLGIEIYEGTDGVHNSAIHTIFAGFARQAGTLGALAEGTPEKLEQATQAMGESLVRERDVIYNRTMLDYYAVAMLVMILFMGGAIGGASYLYEGRKDGTLRRVVASPQNRMSLYVQTVVSTVPQNLMQVLVVMLSSTLLFGASYAATPGHNALLFTMFFAVGFCVNTVFTLVGLFVKFNPTFLVMPIIWVMMFISGTFSKEITISGVTEFMPIWQVHNAAFDLTIFGRTERCWVIILVCAGVAAVFTLLGSLLFRRKGMCEA